MVAGPAATLSTKVVRLDLRRMVPRYYGKPGGIPTLVDATRSGRPAMIADCHKGQRLVATLLTHGIADRALRHEAANAKPLANARVYCHKRRLVQVDHDTRRGHNA